MARSTASSRARPSRQPSLMVERASRPARAGGLEVGVLVVAAGGVVAEDAADAPGGVVAGEQRHHHQALHGQGQVLAHHLGQLVGLALEGEGGALDLFVVLELDLEEAHHLDRHAGRAGDGHRREAVGREDLLHGAVGDDVAHGGPAVAGHDHAVGVAQGDHRGGVGGTGETASAAGGSGAAGRRCRTVAAAVRKGMLPAWRRSPTKSGPGSLSGGKRGRATGDYCPPFWT